MTISWEVLPEADLQDAIGVLVRVVELAGALSFFELATDRVMGREAQRTRPPSG